MCGIAGLIHLDGRPVAERERELLDRMGRAMTHRGPDETSLSCWMNVGMVFRRLAIIDLEHGRQPFETPDGQVSSITNGEIYNHLELRAGLAPRYHLRTRSDCEVLPYLYLEHGLGMFAPVNGMFASALLDRGGRRVLLARDRFGEKPLFYCQPTGTRTLIFASELKALFAHPAVPRQLDWQGLLSRVQNIDSHAGERPSGFAGIERVPAGALLEVSLADGSQRLHRYWSLPAPPPSDDGSTVGQHVERYRALLADSLHLREVADVGCGLFLSGGIDSSTLAALAGGRETLATFSIRSASTLEDAEAAARLCARLGLANHQVSFDRTAAAATPDDWRRILWCCEYPDINAEQLFKYFLHAFARQRYSDLKVMLTGQGSDEFNGGYMGMQLDRGPPFRAADWEHMGELIRERDATHVAFTSGLLGKARSLLLHGVIRRDFIAAMGGREPDASTWRLYVDLYRGNLDTHLWHEDRTAAAHSIENRSPFLDHRLVESLAAIPPRLHGELFADKAILRRALAGVLPEDIRTRRKGPLFYGPHQQHAFRLVHSLLARNRGELVEQAIEGSRITGGPIDAARLRALSARLASDPQLSDFEDWLMIVNMGLLAHMAATLELPGAGGATLPVEEVTPGTTPPPHLPPASSRHSRWA